MAQRLGVRGILGIDLHMKISSGRLDFALKGGASDDVTPESRCGFTFPPRASSVSILGFPVNVLLLLLLLPQTGHMAPELMHLVRLDVHIHFGSWGDVQLNGVHLWNEMVEFYHTGGAHCQYPISETDEEEGK